MTEQTRIPLPDEDAAGEYRRSLIERAANAFDLMQAGPPPVPQGLVSGNRSVKRGRAAGPDAVSDMPAAAAPPAPACDPALSSAIGNVVGAADCEPVAGPATFSGPLQEIDRERLREQGFIVPEGAVTALLEEFRIVKRQLLVQAAGLRRDGGGPASSRVLVCSPHPGEGKTYCSINLALSIASEKESEVLLVDADFAKPSVLSSLGLSGSRGLMDALVEPGLDVLDLVIGTDIPGFSVLPAGHATNADSEYLNSRRTRAVLDRLNENAPNRMVIFDSPPALAASPAAVLAKYVGQALVVVRADRTGQGAIEDAVSLLSACPNIQLILNAVNFSPSGRRFGTYYGYGG